MCARRNASRNETAVEPQLRKKATFFSTKVKTAISLCRDGRFYLVLEQAGAVIGLQGSPSVRVTGHWVIVRAGATTANLELSPSTMGSSVALLAAELQRFTVVNRGKSIYVNDGLWFSKPVKEC